MWAMAKRPCLFEPYRLDVQLGLQPASDLKRLIRRCAPVMKPSRLKVLMEYHFQATVQELLV